MIPAANVAGADYVGELFVLGGIALTAILGGLVSILLKRMREPTRIETLWQRLDSQDKKIGELGDRVESAERKSGAAGRVVRDLARQWPNQHVPRLNPADLAELDDDTIPELWRVKPS